MSTMLTVAEKAEGILHNAFSLKGDDFAFEIPKAMLVGLRTDSEGNLVDVQPEIASHGDIYTLLEVVNPSMLTEFSAVGLVTCGWAAPISNGQTESEPAPSAHPERRRVRLFVCADRSDMASVLRFRDDVENPITDAGEACGPLADALAELMRRV